MKTRLLALFALAFMAEPLRAADAPPERIVPSAVRLTVLPNGSDPKPSQRRTMEIKVHNNGTTAETVNVLTAWFTEGDRQRGAESGQYTLLGREWGGHNVDSDAKGPSTEKLTGWVVVVRRSNGDLLAVKGSASRLEAIARTPGSLKDR